MRDARRGGVEGGSTGRSLLMATATMICTHGQQGRSKRTECSWYSTACTQC
jgi:hypothetical protein